MAEGGKAAKSRGEPARRKLVDQPKGAVPTAGSAKSPRTQRRWDRAWDVTHRFAIPATLVSFLPLPLPMNIILVAVGAAGVRFRTFAPVAAIGALVVKGGWLALGYWIGEPAVAAVETYGRYLWYLTLALIVGILANAWWKGRTKA